eukprot:gene5628-10839_t
MTHLKESAESKEKAQPLPAASSLVADGTIPAISEEASTSGGRTSTVAKAAIPIAVMLQSIAVVHPEVFGIKQKPGISLFVVSIQLFYFSYIDVKKVDQEYLGKKVKRWKKKDSSVKIFFRQKSKAEAVDVPPEDRDEVNDEDVNSVDWSDVKVVDNNSRGNSLLFVYQTEWLLRRYGNELALLDATYRTTQCTLPLFFLVVKMNVDYQVAVAFVCKGESTENIAEAMCTIREWNPHFMPHYFMTDYPNEEIKATEQSIAPLINMFKGQALGTSTILVVTPINAIMLDQVAKMKNTAVAAATVFDGQTKETLQEIENGEFPIVYASPETFLESDHYRTSLPSDCYQKNCEVVVIDKAHCITHCNVLGNNIYKNGEISPRMRLVEMFHAGTPENNANLMLNAVDLGKSCHEQLDMLACDMSSKECMIHRCPDCPDSSKLVEYLTEQIIEGEIIDEQISEQISFKSVESPIDKEQFLIMSSEEKVEEIPDAKGDDVTNSCDGTWQRRGFSSKNGVVTVAIVKGLSSKIVDTETLTNHCNKCKATTNDNETTHISQKNYEGTAGSMEGEGVKGIFKRSQQQYGLSYVEYLRDIDSKSFKNLCEAEPPIYPGKQIEQLECVGHIQKRMGRKLNNLVFQCKKMIYTDSNGKIIKGIRGKNELTKKGYLQNSRTLWGCYQETCWG